MGVTVLLSFAWRCVYLFVNTLLYIGLFDAEANLAAYFQLRCSLLCCNMVSFVLRRMLLIGAV